MGALVVTPGTTDVLPGAHADIWFMVLDQRMLHIGPETWIIQVMGIHASREGLWIQLAAIDEPEKSFVLQVGERTTITDVTAVLRARSETPSPLEVVRVPRVYERVN